MRINSHLFYNESNSGGLFGKANAGWILWIVEDGFFDDRQNLVMSHNFPVKPTKKQLRKLRKSFSKLEGF